MNCQTANNIDIISILQKLGITPKIDKKNEKWYHSPFRNEKTPSFKVNTTKNVFYDFGLGFGGKTVDFIKMYHKCSVKEALQILSNDIFSIHQQPKTIIKSPKYSIKKVTELTNHNLLYYLKTRKINQEFAKKFCCQVHYSFDSKKENYGIGFMNDKGGFEIRNKYSKICLGKKAITTITNQSKTVCLFESWSDFLSYLTFKNKIPNEDFIILNSTSMIKNIINLIETYDIIRVFFDNDVSGKNATGLLKLKSKKKIEDNSIHYIGFKDLNDFLIQFKS